MINRFRITVKDGQTDAIRFLSSMDRSWGLTKRTDEECVIGRDDVVVMKNLSDMPARLIFTGHAHHTDCGRTIFRPSRQQHFTLHEGAQRELILGPGESCPIRCERAKLPQGNGQEVAA